MPRALVVRNSAAEGPGRLGELVAGGGLDVVAADAWREPLPAGPFRLAVILGAPESANDPLPYLGAEERLVRDCVARGVPVLGICLGSQVIARALGGRVYRGPVQEIGFFSDLRPSGGHPLLAGFADPFAAFHWHADTFDLPPGAVRLASSAHYENQAFVCGSAVGLQFHLEADECMVREWAGIMRGVPGADPAGVLGRAGRMLPDVLSNMDAFYRNFASFFGI